MRLTPLTRLMREPFLLVVAFVVLDATPRANAAINPSIPHLAAAGDAQWWDGFRTEGMNDSVYALASYNGNVYAGGKFTTAGVVAATGIAQWDLTYLKAVGTGVNGTVNALVVWRGALYAGGS